MTSLKRIIVLLIAVLAVAAGSRVLCAATYPVIDGEYKLRATLDSSVTTAMKTELWAHVWRPVTNGTYPLVVFLHGNHATCGRFDPALGIRLDDRVDYTTTGKCPFGYEAVPSHLGYAYLARPLAAYGYVVVSINANRGVNCAAGESSDSGLNLRRGRLVLRHLQKLAQWNANGGAPSSLGFQLTGLLDFSQVGLMGHSRGGERMRAAVAQYHDPESPWPERIGPVTFRSLFEIGPVDGMTSRTLNPVGGALPTLVIGAKTFTVSRFPSGSTDRLVFTIENSAFEALEQGAEVSVRVGGAGVWRFSPLDKAIAR